MKIKDVIERFEQFAPLKLQESYDNSGFMIGDPTAIFSKALICVDITNEVINEAIQEQCNLIISHHPLIFGGIKKITTDDATGSCIINAIKHDIAIYAAHTNLDAIQEGVNAALCKKLGILSPSILKPKKGILKKLVTFCPTEKVDDVRQALFEAGAGHIGNYDCCSYNTEGHGTFRALENANPFVGKKNIIHKEPEGKIETIFPAYLEKKLLKALFAAHPYEEVAYDLYTLDNTFNKAGEGMVGELEEEKEATAFLQHIKKVLGTGAIRHTDLNARLKVKKIAVCGGSGGFLMQDAIAAGADMFLTSDLKYHQFFETEGHIILADIGHFESEQFAKEILIEFFNKNFPTFAFLLSKTTTNPVHYF